MKITELELIPIYSTREMGRTGPADPERAISHHVIVRLHTDMGIVGLGEMSDVDWELSPASLGRLQTKLEAPLLARSPFNLTAIQVALGRQEWEHQVVCGVDIAMHDALANGRAFRIFTLIDVYTRECLALLPAPGFSGASVAEVLSDVARLRPLPERILVDNGTEFTSKAMDVWAYWNKVKLDFYRPGRPGDNARIEAFNSLVRIECLSQHWFRSLEEADSVLEEWKDEYNNDRPHGSLRRMTPARYRAGAIRAEDRS